MTEPYLHDQPIVLSHVAAALRRYRFVIAISLAGVVTATLITVAAVYLLASSQTIASMPLLLEFNGANVGQYPNGLKFSVADITVNPVLLEVYSTNDMKRFVGFEQFSRAIYVLESNRALEELAAEYGVKLSDPKLTPVDRERLEREFESKRASISKSGYAIQFLLTKETKDIPHTLIRKTLNDILAVWARHAAIEKKALDIQVPVLSTGIFQQDAIADGDYLVPLLLLRRRVDDVLANLTAIGEIPGAGLVRTPKENVSIQELRLRLDELLRFRLEPLITSARTAGASQSSNAALQVLQGQAAYDERLLASARMRQEAFRNALLTFDSQPSSTASAPQRADKARSSAPLDRQAGDTVMPQLSESFLDRIVDLTKTNADRAYRQKLNEDIKTAALAVVPLDQTVRYDHELIDAFQKPAAHADSGKAAGLDQQWRMVLAEMRSSVSQMNEIYQLASRQLNPSTELYRITGPAVFRVERSVSVGRLAVGSLVAILLAIPLIIAMVLLHNRIGEEEAVERAEHSKDAILS
jgi:hypothetical protein